MATGATFAHIRHCQRDLLTGTGCWSGRCALQTPVRRSDAALASPRPCQLGAVLGKLLSRSGGRWEGTEAVRQAAHGLAVRWDGFLLVGGQQTRAEHMRSAGHTSLNGAKGLSPFLPLNCCSGFKKATSQGLVVANRSVPWRVPISDLRQRLCARGSAQLLAPSSPSLRLRGT